MKNSYTPATTGYSRAFILKGRARPDHVPDYASFMKFTGISQGFGESTSIEMPDPYEYGKYVEVASIEGASERPTTSLVGRFPSAVKSEMIKLAREGCKFDVQLHIGECGDPSDFNSFSKAVIFHDVKITSYSTEDLGSLGSDENAKIDETMEISAKEFFEVVPLTFGLKATDVATNKLVAICIADMKSCGGGNCTDESSGYEKIFAVSIAAGGSPSTPADILCSLDKGATWKAHDIDTMSVSENPTGVAGIGDYVVVITADGLALHVAAKSDFEAGIDPSFTKVTTGLVTGKKPNAICTFGRKAFIVADGGYVYETQDPYNGVTVLDAGSATVDKLNAVHAYSNEYALAVGNNGAVIYTTDGESWAAATKKPVGVTVNLTSCFMKSKKEWFVGASNGKLYYTLDSGSTWVEKALPGTTPTTVKDVKFSNDSVGYVSAVVSSQARLYRTYDGGYSWNVLPEGVGTLPACDTIEQLAVTPYECDFVIGCGLADDATDGVVMLGTE